MSKDYAHDYTTEQIADLDRRIHSVYSQASKDIEAKIDDFNKKYQAKEAIYAQQVKDGKIKQSDFDNWKRGQVFQGEQWKNKRDQVIHVITDSNKIATAMINKQSPDVFGKNASYMNYSLEHTAGVNFGFGVYDKATVTRLIKDNPQILPKWKVNEQKDYVWNRKLVNNAVTQGIIQGESLNQISKRISSSLSMQNENLSKTFARTAMTEAQNAGRLESLKEASELGIEVYKQWMATLDSHTRDSHADVDGESVPVNEKFSNGLEYPAEAGGDPAEVYNCRCTMVGDLKKYPAKYKRYNNEKGKPIQYMTYKDWEKAKSYGQAGLKASKKAAKGVDYSKYGGKENFEIMAKYGDFESFANNSTTEEFDKLWTSFGHMDDVEKAFNNAKDDFKLYEKKQQSEAKKLAKAEKKAQANEYEKAKSELEKMDQKIKDLGADQKFEGIWFGQTVSYADWEAKAGSIEAKKQYYLEQIANTTDTILIEGYQKKLDLLKTFEAHGEEYSKLLAERDAMRKTVAELKPKPSASEIFAKEAYTQERRDAAIWAQTRQEADDVLRSRTGEVWRDATEQERKSIYYYTSSYSPFNEPLRGWEYGRANYNSGTGFVGVGNTDLNAGRSNNGPRLNAMTDIINRCTYDQDMWLQRGCGYGGMDSFFNVDMNILRNGTQKELEDALLGTTPTEFGFMSCGSAKSQGFSGDIVLNVYAPQGTKMMYVEPFSAFGNSGKGTDWDGISNQSSLGRELETILQQGTQFRVTKVERSGGTLYVDMDVIDQSKQQRWTP